MPVKKGKSGRITRALKAREPKLVEGPKRLLLVRGPATSELATAAAKDLVLLKKPDVKVLSRKNDIRPFEDVSSLEFLCEKNESGAFIYVSHNKKRPHNLVIGRMFDGHILDMLELGITAYEGLTDFDGPKKALGAFPCINFVGEEWDNSGDHKLLRQMLLDVFAARDVSGVSLQGLDHVLLVAASGTNIFFRGYSMAFMRADGRIPRVELAAMGPHIDLVIRRVQHASASLEKEAMRIPAQLKEKKVKNVSHDEFGETLGRVHMTRQDLGKLELKKTKALKVLRKRKAGEMVEDGAAGAGGAGADDDEDEDAGAGVAMGGAGAPSVPAAAAPAKSSGGRSKPSAKRARRGGAAGGDGDDE